MIHIIHDTIKNKKWLALNWYLQALLYVIRVMEPVVESDYVVVYFHTQTTSQNHPPMAYLKHMYSVLDNK